MSNASLVMYSKLSAADQQLYATANANCLSCHTTLVVANPDTISIAQRFTNFLNQFNPFAAATQDMTPYGHLSANGQGEIQENQPKMVHCYHKSCLEKKVQTAYQANIDPLCADCFQETTYIANRHEFLLRTPKQTQIRNCSDMITELNKKLHLAEAKDFNLTESQFKAAIIGYTLVCGASGTVFGAVFKRESDAKMTGIPAVYPFFPKPEVIAIGMASSVIAGKVARQSALATAVAIAAIGDEKSAASAVLSATVVNLSYPVLGSIGGYFMAYEASKIYSLVQLAPNSTEMASAFISGATRVATSSIIAGVLIGVGSVLLGTILARNLPLPGALNDALFVYEKEIRLGPDAKLTTMDMEMLKQTGSAGLKDHIHMLEGVQGAVRSVTTQVTQHIGAQVQDHVTEMHGNINQTAEETIE